MKYVKENIFEFINPLYEKEDTKIKKDKEKYSEEEKEGMDVIKKLQDNFKRFVSAAGGKILKYKEFWEDNKNAIETFDEKGNLYKLWDSDYVIGVLELPDNALSPDELNDEIKLVDSENKDKKEDTDLNIDLDSEETEEKTEEDADANEWIRPKGIKFLLEAKDKEESSNLDIDLGDNDQKKSKKEPNLGFSFGDESKKTDKDKPEEDENQEQENDTLDLGDDLNTEDGDLKFAEEGEVKQFFVVYNLIKGKRDEIFRTDNPKVIKSFNDFFENTFKASVKEQIKQFKDAQHEKELEKQQAAEEELKKQRKSKFTKFMKESFDYEEYKAEHPELNWNEADEIDDEDLEAASDFYDQNLNYESNILDDLKSNFRSWEQDSDNYEDTLSLANILKDKHSELSEEEIFEIAKDWTGYNEMAN